MWWKFLPHFPNFLSTWTIAIYHCLLGRLCRLLAENYRKIYYYIYTSTNLLNITQTRYSVCMFKHLLKLPSRIIYILSLYSPLITIRWVNCDKRYEKTFKMFFFRKVVRQWNNSDVFFPLCLWCSNVPYKSHFVPYNSCYCP